MALRVDSSTPIPVHLGELRPGELARITACAGDGPVFQRLCEMGLVEGVRLRLVRAAPFGDPIEIAVVSAGCHLSLRRAEARMIRVERLERP